MQPREIINVKYEEARIHLYSGYDINIIGATLPRTELAGKPFKTFSISPPVKGKFGIVAVVVEIVEYYRNIHQGFFLELSQGDKGIFIDLKNPWHPPKDRKAWFRNGHLYTEVQKTTHTTNETDAENYGFHLNDGDTICRFLTREYNHGQVQARGQLQSKTKQIEELKSALVNLNNRFDRVCGERMNLLRANDAICTQAGKLISGVHTCNRFQKLFIPRKVTERIPGLEKLVGT